MQEGVGTSDGMASGVVDSPALTQVKKLPRGRSVAETSTQFPHNFAGKFRDSALYKTRNQVGPGHREHEGSTRQGAVKQMPT